MEESRTTGRRRRKWLEGVKAARREKQNLDRDGHTNNRPKVLEEVREEGSNALRHKGNEKKKIVQLFLFIFSPLLETIVWCFARGV